MKKISNSSFNLTQPKKQTHHGQDFYTISQSNMVLSAKENKHVKKTPWNCSLKPQTVPKKIQFLICKLWQKQTFLHGCEAKFSLKQNS